MSIEMLEELTLVWQGLKMHVICNHNWGHDNFVHIEIRCREPLPVTNTGYKSHFMHKDDLAEWDSLEAFVIAWLEEEAQSKDWQQIWEARQQLSFGF